MNIQRYVNSLRALADAVEREGMTNKNCATAQSLMFPYFPLDQKDNHIAIAEKNHSLYVECNNY